METGKGAYNPGEGELILRQIICLGNHPYEIVGEKGILRDFHEKARTVTFGDVKIDELHYDFIWDTASRSIVYGPDFDKPGFERIKLPVEVTRIGQELERWDVDYHNEEAKKYKRGIYFIDDYYRRHLDGSTVVLNLEGTAFTIDVPGHRLREKDNPDNIIHLSRLEWAPIMGYELCYDPVTKNIATPERAAVLNPIYLDEMLNYDPLGMARHFGLSVARLPAWDYALRLPSAVAERRKPDLDGFDKKFYAEVCNKMQQQQGKEKRHQRGRKL